MRKEIQDIIDADARIEGIHAKRLRDACITHYNDSKDKDLAHSNQIIGVGITAFIIGIALMWILLTTVGG